jgi:hypothetical protein
MKSCAYCGRDNDDNAVACRECGTTFESFTEPPSPSGNARPFSWLYALSILNLGAIIYGLWPRGHPGSENLEGIGYVLVAMWCAGFCAVITVIGLFCIAVEVRNNQPACHAWAATLISAVVLLALIVIMVLGEHK